MTGLKGMDTAAGLAAGKAIDAGAQEVVRIATALGQALHAFDWYGGDADHCRTSWDSAHRPQLDRVAVGLTDIARLLREEAQAQDQTSGEVGPAAGAAAVGAVAAASPTSKPTSKPTAKPTADQARTKALLDRAAASGLHGDALTRYREHLAAMTPAQRAALDPSSFRGAAATQPDQTTCGSSSLVMSRMINNPAYAMQVINGYDPVTGQTTGGTPQSRFAAESVQMHHQTNGWTDRDGDLQSAWPESLGTAPGPLAQEMSSAGGSGVPGTSYGVDYVRLEDRGSSFDKMVAASQAGHTVPVYVGNDVHPGHVVLVTGATAESVTIYEPSAGRTITVSREQWASDDVDIAGWERPWAIVTPRH